MEKKMILVLLIMALLPFTVFATDVITGYNVKAEVPLGQNVTATGTFVDDAGISGNILCSFLLLDDQNFLIDRADDQYTDSLGNFASRFPITEPDFKRGNTYQLKTTCGGATMISPFDVNQIESIAHTGSQTFAFITEPENTDTLAIWGIIAVFVFVMCAVALYLYKWGKK